MYYVYVNKILNNLQSFHTYKVPITYLMKTFNAVSNFCFRCYDKLLFLTCFWTKKNIRIIYDRKTSFINYIYEVLNYTSNELRSCIPWYSVLYMRGRHIGLIRYFSASGVFWAVMEEIVAQATRSKPRPICLSWGCSNCKICQNHHENFSLSL